MRVDTLASGERVLIDPAVTTSRLFLYFCELVRYSGNLADFSQTFASTLVVSLVRSGWFMLKSKYCPGNSMMIPLVVHH